MLQWLQYQPTEDNIKLNTSHFIIIYYKILQGFEQYPNTKGIRRFNLLPTKNSFSLSTIEICSSCLKDLIGYFTKRTAPNDFNTNKLVYWNQYFNIDKYETNTKIFAYTIYTDGKIAVLRMRNPKVETPNNNNINNIIYDQ